MSTFSVTGTASQANLQQDQHGENAPSNECGRSHCAADRQDRQFGETWQKEPSAVRAGDAKCEARCRERTVPQGTTSIQTSVPSWVSCMGLESLRNDVVHLVSKHSTVYQADKYTQRIVQSRRKIRAARCQRHSRVTLIPNRDVSVVNSVGLIVTCVGSISPT